MIFANVSRISWFSALSLQVVRCTDVHCHDIKLVGPNGNTWPLSLLSLFLQLIGCLACGLRPAIYCLIVLLGKKSSEDEQNSMNSTKVYNILL